MWHPLATDVVVPAPSLALLCLHGAGDVALTWAFVATGLVADTRLRNIVVVAVDLRGHGGTSTTATGSADNCNGETELSTARLVSDVVGLAAATSERFGGVDVALAGHSLGGALAARAASEGLRHRPPLPLCAVLLLEAVEGTAVAGFAHSAAWLRARPTSFASPEEAVAWALSAGMLQSETAARISVPARMRWESALGSWVWRTDVAQAEPHWCGWFEGLSELFSGLPLPKLLVVGGVERLDAALEAAHMQGRFRLEVVPHTGHQLHEDRPEEVVKAFAAFLAGVRRQREAFARISLTSPSPRRRAGGAGDASPGGGGSKRSKLV